MYPSIIREDCSLFYSIWGENSSGFESVGGCSGFRSEFRRHSAMKYSSLRRLVRLKSCSFNSDSVMKIPYLFRFSLPLLATVFLIGAQSFADIIPANRKIDWTPGTVTGVVGGIPTRTTIYKNVVTDLGADNKGSTDCSSIIANALANCP